MDLHDINLKSTKKEIFEAYEVILNEIKDGKNKNIQKGNAGDQPVLNAEASEEGKVQYKSAGAGPVASAELNIELNADKIAGDIHGLKINISNILNKLNDRVLEELKKLDLIKQAVKDENEKLENIYKIKAEANILFNLVEAREQKSREFKREAEDGEEKIKTEKLAKEKEWQREQEEYAYNLKLSRKKEEDDYEFKKQIKEREFIEKLAGKEKELKLRELKITEQENEIKEIKEKSATFNAEIEKAVQETEKRIKAELEKETAVSRGMLMKDIEKERELSKFKIMSLEDALKIRQAQLNSLESELKAANAKSQELAVKIIEYSREPRAGDKKDDSQRKD